MLDEIKDINNPIDFFAWKKIILKTLKDKGKTQQAKYLSELSPMEFYLEKERIIQWINDI